MTLEEDIARLVRWQKTSPRAEAALMKAAVEYARVKDEPALTGKLLRAHVGLRMAAIKYGNYIRAKYTQDDGRD